MTVLARLFSLYQEYTM